MEDLNYQVFYQETLKYLKILKIFSSDNSEKFSSGATWVDLFHLSLYTQMNIQGKSWIILKDQNRGCFINA